MNEELDKKLSLIHDDVLIIKERRRLYSNGGL